MLCVDGVEATSGLKRGYIIEWLEAVGRALRPLVAEKKHHYHFIAVR